METMVDRLAEARHELDDALEERAGAQRRFDEAIGTSAEWSAYQRLRRSTRRMAAADRELRRAAAEADRVLTH
jgi:hypothetical protein